MEVTFLGTGAGMPSKLRNVSSIALDLRAINRSIWLFDCGEGTQHQILKTTIKPGRIEKIFITHLHGDHIYGLLGLLSSRSFQDGHSPVEIYGPAGLQTFIETSFKISHTHLQYPLDFFTVNDNDVYIFDGLKVRVKKLTHGIDSFGYQVIENDQLGELQVDKLKSRGISPGPMYQTIKSQHVTTLANGETVKREDVIGPDKPGRIVTILGDTKQPTQFVDFVKNSDLLIAEATFASDLPSLADQFFHSTITETTQLARLANVKQLCLTHISQRYTAKDQLDLEQEAKAQFTNTQIAIDLLTLNVVKP